MTAVLMADPISGTVALFDEAPGGGDATDPHSQRNRPLLDPATWLANVYLHSDLDNIEVLSETTVTVNHTAGTTGSGSSSGGGDVVVWNRNAADWLLVTHGLGYIPIVLVSQGGKTLWPGMPVQTNNIGGGRYAVPYVSTTEVRLSEWLSSAGSPLAAISINYKITIIRQPRAASGNRLFDFDPTSGVLKLGFDKFSSDRRYLQVVPGGSPLGVFAGRTADLNNGAPRFRLADGTSYDTVPATMKARIDAHSSFGPAMAYNGTFAGSPIFQVQAP